FRAHRQALSTVVASPTASGAASARPSMASSAPANAPALNHHTRTARTASPPTALPHGPAARAAAERSTPPRGPPRRTPSRTGTEGGRRSAPPRGAGRVPPAPAGAPRRSAAVAKRWRPGARRSSAPGGLTAHHPSPEPGIGGCAPHRTALSPAAPRPAAGPVPPARRAWSPRLLRGGPAERPDPLSSIFTPRGASGEEIPPPCGQPAAGRRGQPAAARPAGGAAGEHREERAASRPPPYPLHLQEHLPAGSAAGVLRAPPRGGPEGTVLRCGAAGPLIGAPRDERAGAAVLRPEGRRPGRSMPSAGRPGHR